MSNVIEFKPSQERVDESGKISITRQFHVQYAPADAVKTPARALIDLANSAYAVTNGAAFPGEATVFCRVLKVNYVDSCIYMVTATYKSFTDDPREREINDEVIEYDNTTRRITEYYDRDDEPLDDNEGKHGAQMLIPTQIIRVRRIHSTSRAGTWEDYGGHTNTAAAVVTPGGVTLCDAADGLLLLSAPARQLDTSKWEVVYTFDHDCCAYYYDGTVHQTIKHREPVAAIDKTTGKVTGVNLHYVYKQAILSSAMADE